MSPTPLYFTHGCSQGGVYHWCLASQESHKMVPYLLLLLLLGVYKVQSQIDVSSMSYLLAVNSYCIYS